MYVGAGNKELFLSNLRKNPEEVFTQIGRGESANFETLWAAKQIRSHFWGQSFLGHLFSETFSFFLV